MTEITREQMLQFLTKQMSYCGTQEENTFDMLESIRAALQQQAHVVEIDEGELWSFLRHVLSQGEAIWQDNREKCYEEYSAHLDYAARVRKQQLVAILKGAKRDQAVAAKDGAG